MNKRYQVFVSSTYRDLVQERVEVLQALLELDCMPAGMELFSRPRAIDESDYYLVISAGRYGASLATIWPELHRDGISLRSRDRKTNNRVLLKIVHASKLAAANRRPRARSG